MSNRKIIAEKLFVFAPDSTKTPCNQHAVVDVIAEEYADGSPRVTAYDSRTGVCLIEISTDPALLVGKTGLIPDKQNFVVIEPNQWHRGPRSQADQARWSILAELGKAGLVRHHRAGTYGPVANRTDAVEYQFLNVIGHYPSNAGKIPLYADSDVIDMSDSVIEKVGPEVHGDGRVNMVFIGEQPADGNDYYEEAEPLKLTDAELDDLIARLTALRNS